MLRLIASDMDGTLLENGKVPKEIFTAILELKEAGIPYIACSGRQYSNLRRLFYPVVNDIGYVCENGAVSFLNDQPLNAVVIDRQITEALTRDIQSEGLNPLLSSVTTTYVFAGNRAYTDDIVYRLRNATTVVDEICEITEPIIKISGMIDTGLDPLIKRSGLIDSGLEPRLRRLQAKWSGTLSVTAGGPFWIDCTLADKRTGLGAMLDALGISPADTAAFGDSFNDEAMLDFVGMPYIRTNADPRMKKPGYTLFDNELDVLREMLKRL